MTLLAPLWDGRLDFSASDDRQIMAAFGQNGVVQETDFLVSAGTGLNSSIATGLCLVPNTVAGGGRGASWLVPNVDSPIQAQHPNPSTSWPRVDQVGIKVFDSESGGDASDDAQPFVVQGVASTSVSGTAVTALNALTGAGTPPSNFLKLADVYVPANAANAAAFTYRDRRPWVRGAAGALAGGTISLTNGTAWANVLTWGGQTGFRIECSGLPMFCVVGPIALALSSAPAYNCFFGFSIDGGTPIPAGSIPCANAADQGVSKVISPSAIIAPPTGSHYITLMQRLDLFAGVITLNSGNGQMYVQELLQGVNSYNGIT